MIIDADIRPAAPALSPELLGRLSTLDLPTLGHIVESGFTTGLTRLAGSTPAIGRTVTVKLVDTDSTLVHYLTTLVEPGDFVVIDAGLNRTHAPVGGVMAASFAASGVVGIAVDGTCTDINGLRESGLAVYARGLAAVTTRTGPGPVRGGINVPVSIGSVAVEPGMVAFGDENGLLLATPAALEPVLDRVVAMMAGEPETMARIARGERFGDFFLSAELLDALTQHTQTGPQS